MNLALITFSALKLGAVAGWFLGLPTSWACAVFFGVDLWFLHQIFSPGSTGAVKTFRRFDTPRDEVWLTIDDGPDPQDTPRILDLLDRHEARATFFVIGERAARHPELVAEIARRGHEVAHHTHTHPSGSFWCALPRRLRHELDRALEVLASQGIRPRRFRCPVGIKNVFLGRELASRGLVCIGWNVRSHDTFAREAGKVAARVLKQASPGSILLLHEGPPLRDTVRVHALQWVLEGLQHRGLRCVIPADEQLR